LLYFRCYTNNLTLNISGSYQLALIELDYNTNDLPTAEVDEILLDLDTYFTNNTPINNLTVNLSGAGMGIPTDGNNNANRLHLMAEYVSAGYTATITNNT